MIDAHNHLQDNRFDGQRDDIIAAMKSVGVTACVVNGTKSSDWPAVAQLAQQHPQWALPSFGLHPWNVKGRATDWEQKLVQFLELYPESGVGEIGLDRWIDDPDIESQRIVFRTQLDLAARLDRPCTIHCLKAWGLLLEELSNAERLPRMLIHSFGGSLETAENLLSLGDCWFSFSGYFLHERKAKIVDVFRRLPKDRILIETDAPDMDLPDEERQFGTSQFNHPANLKHIAGRVADQLEIGPQQLLENMQQWWLTKTTNSTTMRG